MDNPWQLNSLYDLQYFCCPECDYKAQERQGFVDHAFWSHPGIVDNLSAIQDGSLADLCLPWKLNESPGMKKKKTSEEQNYVPEKRRKRKQSFLQCETCLIEDFHNLADLNEHVLSEHPEMASPIKCEECDTAYSSGKLLRIHYKDKHGKLFCDICELMCDSGGELTNHMIDEHAKKLIQCGASLCDWSGAEGDIKEHWMKRHSDEEYPFLCSQCTHKTLTISALQSHIKYVHVKAEELFECTKCAYIARSKEHLRRHDRSIHLLEKEFHCDFCIISFGSKQGLQKHLLGIHQVVQPEGKKMKVISESLLKRKLIQCGKCDWKGTKGDIKEHWEEQHPDEPYPYICDKCAHRTLTATALNAHVRNQHLDTEILKCEKCSFTTRTKERLKRHDKNIHLQVRDFQCEFCPSAFQIRQDLQKHLVGVHKVVLPDEKKMKSITNALERSRTRKTRFVFRPQCGKCKETYFTKVSDLSSHVQECYGNELNRSIAFKCDDCATLCVSAEVLEYHIFVEHERTTKVCDICGIILSSITSYTVKQHKKTVHFGIKAHKCDRCDKAFSKSQQLQQHINSVHMNIFRFHCEQCPFKCQNMNNLKAHIMSKHTENPEFKCIHCEFVASIYQRLRNHVKTMHAPRASIPKIKLSQ